MATITEQNVRQNDSLANSVMPMTRVLSIARLTHIGLAIYKINLYIYKYKFGVSMHELKRINTPQFADFVHLYDDHDHLIETEKKNL